MPTSTPAASPIDLTHWSLTLPTGASGHPDVVSSSRLVAGYSSLYFLPAPSGIEFWCPVDGVTTSGSSYPRTELREQLDGANYNWNYTSFDSILTATVAVMQVPSTTKIVIGQIHDNGAGGISGQPLIKLIYDTANGGELRANYRLLPTDANSQPAVTIKTGIALGSPFAYTIKLTKAGLLTVQYNGESPVVIVASLATAWQAQGLYFKAGDYVQDNAGASSEGGGIKFMALAITHR